MTKTILATGGTGYIGSHVAVALLDAGYNVVLFDNLSNSRVGVLEGIRTICQLRVDSDRLKFVEGDIRNAAQLDALFASHAIDAVIHLAGLKAVGESTVVPLEYYWQNVSGSITLLQAMERAGCPRMVFSSSATVYNGQDVVPYVEGLPLASTNPYGRTKLMIEQVMMDLADSPVGKAGDRAFVALRYFNPVGAHASGLIGEDPTGIPNNLFPYIGKVAAGDLPSVQVFGGDYPTRDGTGVRDYLHVRDLADGHVRALDLLFDGRATNSHVPINLGRGEGVSVLEAVAGWSRAVGREIPYAIVDRRPGDIAEFYADASFAKQALGWVARHDLDDMCRDHWSYQQMQAAPRA